MMDRRAVIRAAGYLVLYVALDWVSFIHPFSAVGITPWNPPAGLALVLLLLRGARAWWLVLAGTLCADLAVRHFPAPILPTVVADLAIVAGYTAAAWGLRRIVAVDLSLTRLRDVLWLAGIAALATAAIAVFYVSNFVLLDMIESSRSFNAVTRYWIGDMIGIAVVTPLILVWRRIGWVVPDRVTLVQVMAQGAFIVLALWLIFGVRAADQFRFFYLLFLPLVWAAARFGIKGAAIANLVAQLGLIVAFEWADTTAATVTTFQFLMLTLAAASLLLGASVSERRRAEAELHGRRTELAHVSRLSMAGEMAAALAHELNQPLLATVAFVRAGQRLLVADPPDPKRAKGALDRAVAEAHRAADIIRSLRGFIGKTRQERSPESPSALAADTLALAQPECARSGIRLTSTVDKALPAVHVDKVQVQQVILNLVRNAMEALGTVDRTSSVIEIGARTVADGRMVEFTVADNGPGIAAEVVDHLFEPFNTTKAKGMGLGLSISRTLVESHGGHLIVDPAREGGATFRFTLPTGARPPDEREEEAEA